MHVSRMSLISCWTTGGSLELRRPEIMNWTAILFLLMYICGIVSAFTHHGPSTTGSPQDVAGKAGAWYQCDDDLCLAGQRFCWHAMDGGDDRQCVPCAQLTQVCSQPGDWGRLTDCLVYKCLEPTLAKNRLNEARIIQLEKKVQELTIISGVLGALVFLLIVIFGYYRHQRSRRGTPDTEDAQSLISNERSSRKSSASSASAHQENASSPKGNDDSAAGAGDRSQQAAGHETPAGPAGHGTSAEPAGHDDGSADARALCRGMSHISPTEPEDRAQMVTSNQPYNTPDLRSTELRESRGGRPGLPVPDSP